MAPYFPSAVRFEPQLSGLLGDGSGAWSRKVKGVNGLLRNPEMLRRPGRLFNNARSAFGVAAVVYEGHTFGDRVLGRWSPWIGTQPMCLCLVPALTRLDPLCWGCNSRATRRAAGRGFWNSWGANQMSRLMVVPRRDQSSIFGLTSTCHQSGREKSI